MEEDPAAENQQNQKDSSNKAENSMGETDCCMNSLTGEVNFSFGLKTHFAGFKNTVRFLLPNFIFLYSFTSLSASSFRV